MPGIGDVTLARDAREIDPWTVSILQHGVGMAHALDNAQLSKLVLGAGQERQARGRCRYDPIVAPGSHVRETGGRLDGRGWTTMLRETRPRSLPGG